MKEILQQLNEILPGVWRYRWTALLGALALSIASLAFIMTIPEKFQAATRVHVDTATILGPLMRGIAVQPDRGQQVQMMARTLMSRPNLERIMKMSDLDLEVTSAQERESMLDNLSRTLKLNAGGRTNIYKISYQSDSPEKAKKVVESLLDIFVENNLGGQRQDSEQASQFIDEQVERYENRLREAENALKNFKIKNLGAMPDSRTSYVARAGEARFELELAQAELRQAMSIRNALAREVALESEVGQSVESFEPEILVPPITETDVRLEAAQKSLDNLLIRFTENHPDVASTKAIIEQLEVRKQAEVANFRAKPQQNKVAQLNPRGVNSAYDAIRASLAEAEASVAGLRARVRNARGQLARSDKAAETIPKVEAELAQLNRDYEITKKNYEALLARRESIDIAGNMDKTTKLADFRIVDPPRASSQPVAPNRPLLMMAALGGSLLFGLGLAFLRTQLRPVFHDPASIRGATDLPILGVVSHASINGYQAKRRLGLLAFSALTGLFLGLFALSILYVDRYGVPEDIQSVQIPAKLQALLKNESDTESN